MASVSEVYRVVGAMPADAAEAGLASPQDYENKAVQAIEYARLSETEAALTISYKAISNTVPQGAAMVFTGTGSSSGVKWSCRGGGTLPERYKPDNCRG